MATRTATITSAAHVILIPPKIITLAEYKVVEDINASDQDAQLQQFINQADQYIRNYLDQDVFASEGNTEFKQKIEIFTGYSGRSFYPKERPITTVDTVEFDNLDGWEEFDTDSYTPTTDGSRVWFVEGLPFPDGRHNLRITYRYGYSLAYPADMKRACHLLTKHYTVEMAHHGISSQSDEEQTFSYFAQVKIPPSVESLLQSYMRF